MLAETAGYISYGVTLPEAQLSRIPPVAPEKKSAQIRHRIAHKRKQFRVRATLASKALPGAGNPDISIRYGYPPRVGTAHNSRKGKGGCQPMVRLFLTALVALILVLLLVSPAR